MVGGEYVHMEDRGHMGWTMIEGHTIDGLQQGNISNWWHTHHGWGEA